jgi:hypothetical protein
MAASDDRETGFDPRRKLCPDGSCVGVIGSDGKCCVCGTADPGGGSGDAYQADATQPDDSEVEFDADRDDSVDDDSVDDDSSSEGFEPNRRLCSDDNCIGVIGKDNRCPVCGRVEHG